MSSEKVRRHVLVLLIGFNFTKKETLWTCIQLYLVKITKQTWRTAKKLLRFCCRIGFILVSLSQLRWSRDHLWVLHQDFLLLKLRFFTTNSCPLPLPWTTLTFSSSPVTHLFSSKFYNFFFASILKKQQRKIFVSFYNFFVDIYIWSCMEINLKSDHTKISLEILKIIQ